MLCPPVLLLLPVPCFLLFNLGSMICAHLDGYVPPAWTSEKVGTWVIGHFHFMSPPAPDWDVRVWHSIVIAAVGFVCVAPLFYLAAVRRPGKADLV